jgi:hypothetical protein
MPQVLHRRQSLSRQIESAAESARPRLYKYTAKMNNYATGAPANFRAYFEPRAPCSVNSSGYIMPFDQCDIHDIGSVDYRLIFKTQHG